MFSILHELDLLNLPALCFLIFFDFVHPCHRLLYSQSLFCEYTADVTIIIAHLAFIFSPRYLLYFINGMLSAIQKWLRSLNMVWLPTQLRRMFFFFSISTSAD